MTMTHESASKFQDVEPETVKAPPKNAWNMSRLVPYKVQIKRYTMYTKNKIEKKRRLHEIMRIQEQQIDSQELGTVKVMGL